jgi:hypothetical protein
VSESAKNCAQTVPHQFDRITTSPTGWTNDDICANWFTNHFLPQARAHANNDKPIILLYDGHGSHIQESIIDIAMDNNTSLYLLPAHTTHKLQPCDVGAFGPLKKHWSNTCAQYFELTSKELGTNHVVLAYMAARRQAFIPSTITKAWENSGISINVDGDCICTPEVFTAADFAPSTITSTRAHLPDSFPDGEPEDLPEWARTPDVCSEGSAPRHKQTQSKRVNLTLE